MYNVNKTHQLKPGKGAGIWRVMEPHCQGKQGRRYGLAILLTFLPLSGVYTGELGAAMRGNQLPVCTARCQFHQYFTNSFFIQKFFA
jgi:hypothetical protein